MLLQAVLALCLVSVVLGDGCCTPDQWEGTEYVLGGFSKGRRTGGIETGFRVSYDAGQQAVAVSGMFRRRGQYKAFKVIYNFQKSKGYFMLPKEQKCKSFALKRKFRKACIPDDAKKLGDTFFGAGGNTLDVTAYAMRFQNKKRRTDIGAVALVTKEGCIPVTEDVSGTFRRVSFFENVNFAGITPGIKDQTVFTPSEYCNNGTVDSEPVEMIDDGFYEEYSMLQFTHPGVARDTFERAHDDADMQKFRNPY